MTWWLIVVVVVAVIAATQRKRLLAWRCSRVQARHDWHLVELAYREHYMKIGPHREMCTHEDVVIAKAPDDSVREGFMREYRGRTFSCSECDKVINGYYCTCHMCLAAILDTSPRWESHRYASPASYNKEWPVQPIRWYLYDNKPWGCGYPGRMVAS